MLKRIISIIIIVIICTGCASKRKYHNIKDSVHTSSVSIDGSYVNSIVDSFTWNVLNINERYSIDSIIDSAGIKKYYGIKSNKSIEKNDSLKFKKQNEKESYNYQKNDSTIVHIDEKGKIKETKFEWVFWFIVFLILHVFIFFVIKKR